MTRLRVLIADDDADHRFLITRALRASGDIDVEAVADGDELLDCVHGRGAYVGSPRPHVIFLDLRMPRRDGLEVLAQLKAEPGLASIPVVVLTTSDQPADIDAAYDRGSNAYVTKPRQRSRMQAELRALTGYWTSKVALPGLAS